jgi:DNA (cytosine-5)-methyltransferase 1
MIWIESDNPNGFQTGKRFSIGQPAPCIMAGGMGGDSLGHWHIHNDGKAEPMPRLTDKPPYRVPSMDEVRALPWNGYTVASTFAGGGGSSTGYRMAGFKVVWANELTASARASYAANMASGTILDGHDIRAVRAEDILEATGLAAAELDVFDGSPPCVSFSTAGKREKGWGKVTTSHDATQRQDDLFHEYVRLLRGLQPRVFVAENVSGLIKGTAKGYFLEILAALKDCGYRVEARLLDAQWLGVPQMRQRLIFVGVRHDLGLAPAFPKPLAYRYSVRDAMPWIGKIEGRTGSQFKRQESDITRPMNSMMASDPEQTRYEIEAETDISRYAIGAEWDKLKPGEQSTKYRSLVKPSLGRPCPTVTCPPGEGWSPTAPSSSASVVHPTERRKFTIAELRRICGFPDDYVLKGSYADQWARCGNAVPPVMMRAIAETIRDRVLAIADQQRAAA